MSESDRPDYVKEAAKKGWTDIYCKRGHKGPFFNGWSGYFKGVDEEDKWFGVPPGGTLTCAIPKEK